MEQCIFCQIVNKEIPCYQVYEDHDFLAFLDIQPRNEGHTMIIPKKHYRWVWDVKENYSPVVNKVAQALKKSFQTELVVSFIVGEDVPHAHIHLVPRFPNDGHGALIDLKKIKTISPEKMKEIAHRIRNSF